ncbi:MAG: 50S ribosomal protein L24 [Halobacteriovoraceae bacterium]|jgi:large subunit ribosomal protein L24|nr:50S ribosomal protein L24 [Halobacteriovoraceae bacterium]
MQKIKLNDEVIVLAGKDKNKKGKVRSMNLKQKTVIVDGVNVVKKAVKPTQESPNGGFSDMEKGINISNIAVVSPKTGKATRVRIEEKDGKKIRVAVACGSSLA